MKNAFKELVKNASFSGISAGLIVALVGMTSSAIIIFQAASSAGLSPIESSSWLGSLCIGMGILTIVISMYYKSPILFAWSTPGAAILVTGLKGVLLSDAIGAFLFSAFLISIFGISGIFEKLMNKIPLSIASALLAGVLFHFATDTFIAIKTQPILIIVMLFTYLISKMFFPKLSMLFVVIISFILATIFHLLHFEEIQVTLTHFQYTSPTFSFKTILSIGLPLFIVTMASQNLTGITVMRAHNFHTPISPLITFSGLMNLIIAPFGGFAINLAAITAAIAMGPIAHHRAEKRYFAAVFSGIIYLIIGIFSGTVMSIFAAFPKEMVVGIAGIALFGTIASCLDQSLKDLKNREAAFITFAVTASGLSIYGMASAFWGLIAGLIAQFLLVTMTDK
ncbi:MAG: benzoate/H(+) symporter BenE family transporter [Bacteriovorax sp.]|nr:benzoate/H(+) symporter BenE family transporter [Bacteriovorax sp.]